MQYEHKIPLDREGVLSHHLAWAEKNCKGKFGWHFDEHSNAIISFEKLKDANFWALKWMDEYS